MATYDLLFAAAGVSGLATNGTVTFAYPTGRSVTDYFPGGEVLDNAASQIILAQSASNFTVSYTKAGVVLTYLGTRTLLPLSTLRLQCRVKSTEDAVTAVNLALNPGYIANRVYPLADAANNNGVVAVDLLYFFPFRLHLPITAVAAIMRVATGGAASAVKAGIWPNSNLSMRPVGKPLLSDNSGVATTASTTNVSLTGIAGTLPAGLYWFGSKFTSATPPTMQDITTPCQLMTMLVGGAVGGTYPSLVTGFSIADTYANDISATDIAEGAAFTILTATIVPNACLQT
jgi:hypothetical protein